MTYEERKALREFLSAELQDALTRLMLAVEKTGKPLHNVDLRLSWTDVDDDENVVQVRTNVEAYLGYPSVVDLPLDAQSIWFVEETKTETLTGVVGDGRF